MRQLEEPIAFYCLLPRHSSTSSPSPSSILDISDFVTWFCHRILFALALQRTLPAAIYNLQSCIPRKCSLADARARAMFELPFFTSASHSFHPLSTQFYRRLDSQATLAQRLNAWRRLAQPPPTSNGR
jgi:hypothetical protein